MKAYIQHFSYKAITTEDWKSFLYQYFDAEKEKLEQVNWDLWFNKPGLAPVKGQYDTSLQEACTKLANQWKSGKVLYYQINLQPKLTCKTKTGACEKCSSADLENFSSGQLQEFLDQLVMAEALAIDLVEKMGKIYPTISESKNSEVRFRWIRVGLKVDQSSIKLEKISILGSLRKRYWQCLGNGDGTGPYEVYPALVPRFGLLGKRFLNQIFELIF